MGGVDRERKKQGRDIKERRKILGFLRRKGEKRNTEKRKENREERTKNTEEEIGDERTQKQEKNRNKKKGKT